MDRQQRTLSQSSKISLFPVDPLSQATLQRFGLMMLAIVSCAVWSDDRLHALVALTAFAALTNTVVATILEETVFQPNLNRWDEAAAYVGLYSLSRFAGGAAP
jgi:hypothetical protein